MNFKPVKVKSIDENGIVTWEQPLQPGDSMPAMETSKNISGRFRTEEQSRMDQIEQEIVGLKAQVAALQARLDEQEAGK